MLNKDFTVIIPTFNEQKYLPRLLESIKKQTVQPKEIIVADNYSKDDTTKIAIKYGCKVVPGGSPAKGRNNGAKIATTKILVFIDADAEIKDERFLEKTLIKFEKKNLDIATCFFRENNHKFKGKLYLLGNNIEKVFNVLLYKGFKRTIGESFVFVIMREKALSKLGGFDEKMYNHEDSYFIDKAAQHNLRYECLLHTIYPSGRRYENKTYAQILLLFVLIMSLILYRLIRVAPPENLVDKHEKAKGKLGGNE
jgi:glycosyltransferase involved in cell wall biosynthesis